MRSAQAAEPAAVDLPHVGERGQAGPRRGDLLGVIVGLDHDGDRARVAEDPLDLLERGGRVDRNGDAAGGQDRVVERASTRTASRDISATRSPGWIPAAMKPAAMPRTCSANSRQVTGVHAPFTLRFRPTVSGQFSCIGEDIIGDVVIRLHDVCRRHREFLHRCPLISVSVIARLHTLGMTSLAGQGRRSRAALPSVPRWRDGIAGTKMAPGLDGVPGTGAAVAARSVVSVRFNRWVILAGLCAADRVHPVPLARLRADHGPDPSDHGGVRGGGG